MKEVKINLKLYDLWYHLQNYIDIEYFFNCVIIDKGATFREAKYIINTNEDLDWDSLSISEKNKGDFVKDVVPKLKELLKNRLHIIDKRGEGWEI
ncbi:hypothetical protein KYB31_12325 [Clostridium felsineum]|uniref:hypothetical protein n=1 Tax=Clostridium felsineum TaxID=36839 RepID=UPI00214D66A9|nr:hypothetical protein [Clostridium felsineum]MCR3759760.1 hypothetical protein [Clostridium felsineum]